MKKKTVFTILIILWLCLIFGHSMMPGDVSSMESGFFTDLLMKIFPVFDNVEDAGFFVRKCAHFTEFMVLGVLLFIRVREFVAPFVKNLLIAGAAGLTAAFIDESIQLFVEGRAGTVPDMWVDLAGVVTGCLVVKGIGLVCDYIKIKREA